MSVWSSCGECHWYDAEIGDSGTCAASRGGIVRVDAKRRCCDAWRPVGKPVHTNRNGKLSYEPYAPGSEEAMRDELRVQVREVKQRHAREAEAEIDALEEQWHEKHNTIEHQRKMEREAEQKAREERARKEREIRAKYDAMMRDELSAALPGNDR